MADLENLPDLEVSPASFLAQHLDLLRLKVNKITGTSPVRAAKRAIAQWANLVDGALLRLQDDYAERRVDGIVRIGDGRAYYLAAEPDFAAPAGSLAMVSDGTLWQTADGSTWTQVGAGGDPEVVREIDYTTIASSGALSDGNLTIGGVEHTVVNVANASQCEIVNGTGIALRYRTTGTGTVAWNGSTQTGPGIYALNANLIPGFSQRRRYLYMWHYSVPATWHSGDLAQFLLYVAATGNYDNSFYEGLSSGATHTRGGGRHFSSSSSINPAHGVFNGSTIGGERREMSSYLPAAPGTTVNPSPDRNAYDVIAIEHLSASQVAVYAGVYDGGWPDLDDLVLIGETEYSTNNNAGMATMRSPLTRVLVGLSGGVGSADPHGVDVHRLRVLDLGQ